MLAILAAVLMSVGDLPAPLPPPAFSTRTRQTARALEATASLQFERGGYARTYSNGRYVEAMGTARRSREWEIATRASVQALITCRALRRALRGEKDFMLSAIQSGSRQDVLAASFRLGTISQELSALEEFFSTETVRYREMMTAGWGDPHCVSGALEGMSPPNAVCPKGSGGRMR